MKAMKRFLLPLMIFAAVSCAKKAEAPKVAEKDTIQQKSGQVLSYEKPARPLVSMQRDDEVYGENFKLRLRKIAEYYIANSERSLVKFHKAQQESTLGFSFEKNDWEGVDYVQIGIFNKSGSNVSTLQWLFYEPKTQQLFEFDLNKKQIIPFNLK